MSEERKADISATEAIPVASAAEQLVKDPEVVRLLERREADKHIQKYVANDSHFEALLDVKRKVGDKEISFREELQANVKLAGDPERVSDKAELYANVLLKQATPPAAPAPESAKPTIENRDSAPLRPGTEPPQPRDDGKYAPASLSIDELRAKGFDESQIAKIKAAHGIT